MARDLATCTGTYNYSRTSTNPRIGVLQGTMDRICWPFESGDAAAEFTAAGEQQRFEALARQGGDARFSAEECRTIALGIEARLAVHDRIANATASKADL